MPVDGGWILLIPEIILSDRGYPKIMYCCPLSADTTRRVALQGLITNL